MLSQISGLVVILFLLIFGLCYAFKAQKWGKSYQELLDDSINYFGNTPLLGRCLKFLRKTYQGERGSWFIKIFGLIFVVVAFLFLFLGLVLTFSSSK